MFFLKRSIFLIFIFCFGYFVFAEQKLIVQDWHKSNDIEYIECSRDGKYILSVSRDDVKIWDFDTGLLIRSFSMEHDPFPKFLHDGKEFIRNTSKGLTRYNIENEDFRRYQIDSCCYTFSKDGKWFLSEERNKLVVYDGKTFIPIFDFPLSINEHNRNDKIVISENSNIVCLTQQNVCTVYNFKEKKVVSIIKCEDKIEALDISPDEKYIALGFNKKGFHIMPIDDIEGGIVLKNGAINDIKFLSDSQNFFTLDKNKYSIKCWNYQTKKVEYSIKLSTGELSGITSFTITPDKKKVLLATSESIEIRDIETGKLLKIIKKASDANYFAYNQKLDSLYMYGIRKNNIVVMNDIFLEKEIPFDMKKIYVKSDLIPVNEGFLFVENNKDNILMLCNESSKKIEKLIKLEGGLKKFVHLSASLDGLVVCYTDDDMLVHVYDVKKGSIVTVSGRESYNVQVSPTGKFISFFEGEVNNGINYIYDVKRNKILKRFSTDYSLATGKFSFDDKYYGMRNGDYVEIYNTSNWKLVSKYEYGEFCFSFDNQYLAIQEYSYPSWHLKIYNLSTGKTYRDFVIEDFDDFVVTKDLSKIIGQDYSGKIFCYSVNSGELLSYAVADSEGDWITYTPKGYFNGSENGIKKFIHLVDGMTVSELGQYAETLYRPDLVAAKLRGEDISKEEGTTSLAELVSTGEAPLVSFVNPPASPNSRDITVNFSVQDMGGGIGSVYLKLNDKVIQLADGSRKLELVGDSTSTTQKSSGKTTQFSHLLTLQNGENTLEAYAYNSAGKIESLHATAKITWQGKTAKPNLYVLAVGVNKYRDRSLWLNYAVPDATSIADQFRSVKGNLYQSVNVTSIFDENVTADGISSAFNSLASKVSADDVFIFYLSGHGTTHTDGDYYFIPVDFRFRNAESIPESAISKHFITENLSKIKAQKSLVMLDTCNSGAFISTGARGMAEKTAIDRLSRATGQATIAASSDTQSAMEGYEGHGIFTYVILEGLAGKADSNGDGFISLSELSSYAEEKVPDYSYAKWGYEQYPQIDLRKQSNFPLVGK